MVTPQLLEFIKSARGKSLPESEIQEQLRTAGWPDKDVAQALRFTDAGSPPPLPPNLVAAKASPSSPWDAFQHVLLFICLGVSSVTLALLLHTFVDQYSPGLKQESFFSYLNRNDEFRNNLIRGYLASLIVTFPLFVLFFLKLTRETLQKPERRQLWARKFLTYLTLTVTFVILIFSLIDIIKDLLNGNVSLNFLLHFSITTSISGSIFGYYLKEVWEDRLYA